MIRQEHALVYYSTTKGRRYFSRSAAIRAEATATIERKHPTEKFDPECGGGFHWTSLPRSDVLLRRMSRIVKKSIVAMKGTT